MILNYNAVTLQFFNKLIANTIASVLSQRAKSLFRTPAGGGTNRPLPRDGVAEELREDSTIGPHPKVWTIDQE